ncbi:MAG: hypothetical protein WA020_04245 [Candidatus Acidiferrales bacterium]
MAILKPDFDLACLVSWNYNPAFSDHASVKGVDSFNLTFAMSFQEVGVSAAQVLDRQVSEERILGKLAAKYEVIQGHGVDR